MADPEVSSSQRRPWRPWRSKVVWAIVVAVIAFVRSGVPAASGRMPVSRTGIRTFNRRWVNPLMLRFAGARPWGIARLEHRGRGSGMLRATPVWADPVSEGFLIPMPYGKDVDWANNLLHSGKGVLQHQGVRYQIGFPRILPAAEALPDLPALTRRVAGPHGVRSFMRVDVLPNLTAESPVPV